MLSTLQEIPLPQGIQQPQLAKRIGNFLCLADSENYNMIDLHEATLNPLIPISQAQDGSSFRSVIQTDANNEFLVLSWTGSSTLCIFFNGSGDPPSRLIEYPMQVSSLSTSLKLARISVS
jgi:vacuolar protein sorting-associated protein 3